MSDHGHDKHRERMRQRFIEEKGFDSFNDHQVLEMLLYLCLPRCDTNRIAHALLNKFGTFSSVLEKLPHELSQIEGIGEKSSINIKMITEFCRRYYTDCVNTSMVFDSSEKIAEFIMPRFIGVTDELVYCISMDNTCRIGSCEIISRGDTNSAGLSVRRVVECAIRHKAVNIILAHNHPHGLALPSNNDIIMTQEIIKGLNALDINLIDHFIVARDDCVSLRESDYI